LVLEAIESLDAADARFIIAPRHLAAAASIAREAAARGLRAVQRSHGKPGDGWQILILDTMGELRNFYSIAVAAVVCGGFGKFGGHNPYEALQAGAPVLFGPHFEHFEYAAGALAKITPEARVSHPGQIAARLRQWLNDENSRRRAAALQRQTLPDAAAVTRRYLDELSPYLVAVHE
jgi:3-deoxy-D-manno-octulosonic-acid transferase